MKFSSPLVIRPHARQIPATVVLCLTLCLFSVYSAVTAAIGGVVLGCIGSTLLLCAVVYHMYTTKMRIRRDVTALISSVFSVAAAKGICNILFFLEAGVWTFPSVCLLLLELLFWGTFIFVTARTVCGRYKLIVPLLLLFFAFFYTFIKFSLRDFMPLLTQLLLLLCLWLPLDSIAFTSLTTNDDKA